MAKLTQQIMATSKRPAIKDEARAIVPGSPRLTLPGIGDSDITSLKRLLFLRPTP